MCRASTELADNICGGSCNSQAHFICDRDGGYSGGELTIITLFEVQKEEGSVSPTNVKPEPEPASPRAAA